MCLLFLSYRLTPQYKIVLAANRDEFISRPTAPLGFLDENRAILGGKDLSGGGTWLAINKNLKIAALTNYREPQLLTQDLPSRGEIVLDFVEGKSQCLDYLEDIAERDHAYSGFNLIAGDKEALYYYSNRAGGPRELQPGFYGLSNHLLDTPWPKVTRGKILLFPHMVQVDKVLPEPIFETLTDTHRPEDHALPDTGVGMEWERLLSTIFIDSPGYGTRSSAVITVDYNDRIEFYEKTYLRSDGNITSQHVFKSFAK